VSFWCWPRDLAPGRTGVEVMNAGEALPATGKESDLPVVVGARPWALLCCCRDLQCL
jgi:hypothetical protein